VGSSRNSEQRAAAKDVVLRNSSVRKKSRHSVFLSLCFLFCPDRNFDLEQLSLNIVALLTAQYNCLPCTVAACKVRLSPHSPRFAKLVGGQ